MKQLSKNLTKRRKEKCRSVPEVHAELNRMGLDVAFSTVAGWFNGSRGIRDIQHLKALCVVLDSDLNALAGDEVKVVEGEVDVTIVREMNELTPVQREAVLAVIRSMRSQ